MKLTKYKEFISKFHIKDKKFCSMVECAYQDDRKVIYEIGTIHDLESLQTLLDDMRLFYIESQNEK